MHPERSRGYRFRVYHHIRQCMGWRPDPATTPIQITYISRSGQPMLSRLTFYRNRLRYVSYLSRILYLTYGLITCRLILYSLSTICQRRFFRHLIKAHNVRNLKIINLLQQVVYVASGMSHAGVANSQTSLQ